MNFQELEKFRKNLINRKGSVTTKDHKNLTDTAVVSPFGI